MNSSVRTRCNGPRTKDRAKKPPKRSQVKEDLDYGPVLITRGKYKGRIGYYDDDDLSKGVVYFGDYFVAHDHAWIHKSFFSYPTVTI
jgi:hypothetical protein